MKQIPEQAFPRRDLESLKSFLAGCRREALERDRWQLVSISLPVRHIEPLAVLHSIFEPGVRHFYLERPSKEEAVAGAEAVVEASFAGAERMEQSRAFAAETLENTIVFGDLSRPFAGPHFFCGFTFSDFPGDDALFEPGALFVPRWQVSRRGGYFGAVANLRIDKDSDLDFEAQRVWAAHQKFSAFDYRGLPAAPMDEQALISTREAGGEGAFRSAVRRALEEIRKGSFEKIVLARAIDLQMAQPYQPLVYLNRLREEFSGCYAFSFANGRGQSFIGVSPERLVRLRNGVVHTMALAGTARRGATAAEDAHLARSLLESDKDRREHRVVLEAIRRRLARLGLEAEAEENPSLMQLANVQHLWTPVAVRGVADRHILELVEQLHPTPAVGGSPRAITTQRIHDLEPFDRSLYAGALGFFDFRGEGEFVVAIRSALIEGKHARLYAGSGIVEGSDPALEHQETELKLKAMLPSLTG